MSSCFFKLTPADAARLFKQNGYLPADEANRACLKCGHKAVDEPNSNLRVAEINLQKLTGYEEKVVEYEANVAAGVQVSSTRKLTKPKLACQQLVCHCGQIGCFSDDPRYNNCIIKCIDPDTSQRYGRDADGKCLCPICACPCRVAYRVSLCTRRTSLLIVVALISLTSPLHYSGACIADCAAPGKAGLKGRVASPWPFLAKEQRDNEQAPIRCGS